MKLITIALPDVYTCVQIELEPGDTVDQVISLVLPAFFMEPGQDYRLCRSDGPWLRDDLYPQVADGERLLLIHRQFA